jgi:hypothetical protein
VPQRNAENDQIDYKIHRANPSGKEADKIFIQNNAGGFYMSLLLILILHNPLGEQASSLERQWR